MRKIIYIILLVLIMTLLYLLVIKGDTTADYDILGDNTFSNLSFNNGYVSSNPESHEIYDMDIPDSFELVNSDSAIELYLERETMAIAIKKMDNGYVWYSYDVSRDYNQEISDGIISLEIANQIRSGVSMRTYNVFTPGLRTLLDKNLIGKDEVMISYTILPEGFIAHIDFIDIDILFDVNVVIENEDLIVSIPYESIDEYSEELWMPGNSDISINDILIYPFFGSTSSQEDGYIVIPDGSGALISLVDEPENLANYNASVYGKDLGYTEVPIVSETNVETIKPLARVTLPIYGIIHNVNNSGVLVISENGANYATYNFVSKSLVTEYYQSYFHYNYRTSYKQFQSRSDDQQYILGFQKYPNEFEIKQRYVFLTENANYVGVAKGYRQFLEDTTDLKDENLSPMMKTNLDIIGNEIEQGIFFKKNVSMTSYSGLIDIINEIQKDNISNISITFKTFVLSDSQYRFDVLRSLGGKGDFSKLMNFIEENNIEFEPYVDYINSYEDSKYIAARMNRKEFLKLNYSYMYLYKYINNPSYLSDFIDDDLDVYEKHGVSSIALNGMNDTLFTSILKDRTVQYSTENMEFVLDSLEKLQSENVRTSFYNPDSYLYEYVNNYYDAPLSSSELMFVDATIPLVQLVVSGHMDLYSPSINFVASEDLALLRMVEYGLNPTYTLSEEENYLLKYTNASNIYISNYSVLRSRILLQNDFLISGLSKTSGIEMTDHQFLDVGVSLSTFSNGTQIIVNYNDYDYNYNNLVIEARGYVVK